MDRDSGKELCHPFSRQLTNTPNAENSPHWGCFIIRSFLKHAQELFCPLLLRLVEHLLCGVPCSTIVPPSMKITRSDTASAKLISCVTMTIVIFSAASRFMTFSTSPVSSGSSADVGSSKNSTSGLSASARAMATRCLLSAGELVRIVIQLVRKADACERLLALRAELGVYRLPVCAEIRPLFGLKPRREHDVLQRRILRKQVEILENQPEVQAIAAYICVAQRFPAPESNSVSPLTEMPPLSGRPRKFMRPRRRGLAASGRADDGQRLSLLQREADTPQNLQ